MGALPPRNTLFINNKKVDTHTFVGVYFHWIGKPPALPVEAPRKKALASSIERSELLTANYQGRKTYVRTADARLRAAGQVMRVK